MSTNYWIITATGLAAVLTAIAWDRVPSPATLNPIVPSPVPALRAKQAVPQLTVEETIGAVFTFGETRLYRWANPDAKVELFRLLDEEVEDMGHQVPIVQMIGYIGDEKDAVKLCDILKGYRGILFESRRCHPDVAISIFNGLGLMSRRGVPGADEIIREMLSPDYWKDTFKWHPPDLKAMPLSAELESVNWALWAYAISGQDDLSEIRQSILMRIEDEKVRDYMAWRCDLTRMKAEIQRLHAEEVKIPTESERQFLRRLYNERDSVWPRIKKLPEAEAEFRRKHILRRGPDLPPIEAAKP